LNEETKVSNADTLAEIVKHAPHSFRAIRVQSSLKLTARRQIDRPIDSVTTPIG
jgi:hypothetical protein